MGRRVRHFNPANMGATMALDARFIQGIGSGSSIQTWSSRQPATFNVTQSTAGNRPLMNVSSSTLGGSQNVAFTSANSHSMTNASAFVASTTSEWAIFQATANSAGTYAISQSNSTTWVGAQNSGTFNLQLNRAQIAIWNTSAVNTSNTDSASISQVACGRRSGSAQIGITTRTTRAEQLASTGATANLSTARTGSALNTYYSLNIGAICGILAATTLAQRNRIMHSYAFSFKLAQ